MYELLYLLLLPWMAFLASAAGGNSGAAWLVYQVGTRWGAWWGSAASRLPEIVWAITISVVSTISFDLGWYGLLVFPVAYVSMELGHGNAFHMGFAQNDYPPRRQSLDVVVLPVCKLFGWVNRGWQYCWLYMGLKGLLIGLPMLPAGAALSVLWPASYYVGFRYTMSSALAEPISGAWAGLAAAVLLYLRFNSLAFCAFFGIS